MKFRFLNELTAHTAVAAAGLTLMTGLAAAAGSIDTTANASATSASGGSHVAVAQDEADKPVLPFLAPAPAKPAAPSMDKLIDSPQGAQERFTPSPEQMGNTREIVKAAKEQGLSDRAAVIAVATSLQESKLVNLGHLGERNDHDSQGLFQQRPSSGWGSVEQITDPNYSATAFYKSLKQVDGWQDMPLTEAAQTVQVSAFPDAYAQWEKMAADLVLATYDTGPYADIADKADDGKKADKPEKADDGKKADKPEKGEDAKKDDAKK